MSSSTSPGQTSDVQAEVATPTRAGACAGGFQDQTGAETLELLRRHDGYSRWIWDRVRAFGSFGGRVLEVGCGIGNFTDLFLDEESVDTLHVVEPDVTYVEGVRARIDDERFRAFCSTAAAFEPDGGGYDRVVSFNVLEHIENDREALQSIERALVPGGEAWILVPAHPALFSELDRGLSHYRRYTRAGLRALARDVGLEPMAVSHFNPVGAVGWWVTGRVLRARVLPSSQVRFYSCYGITISRWVDRLNPFPFGISLVARLRKPD